MLCKWQTSVVCYAPVSASHGEMLHPVTTCLAFQRLYEILIPRPNLIMCSGIRQQHTVLFGADHGSIRLFVESANLTRHLWSPHYIHLCFQARMSKELHLAPQPRL